MGWCALCIHPSILILETPKPNLNCQLARFEVSLFSDHKSIFAQISWIFSLLGEASLHLSLLRFHVTLLRTSLLNEKDVSRKLPTLASFFSSGYWQAIVDVKSRTCGVKLEREVWQGAPDCLVQTGLFVQIFCVLTLTSDGASLTKRQCKSASTLIWLQENCWPALSLLWWQNRCHPNI